jgi:membrane dipeptidase
MNVPWVIDGHNDLPWAARKQYGLDLPGVDIAAGVPALQTDIPRLRAGNVGAQFWSVFVPADLAGESAVTATLEQVDLVRRLVAAHPEDLALAATADEVEQAVDSGRIASLIGVEGGHSINGSLGVLRMLHGLGARYLTLTHNRNLPWADSATDAPAAGGLTAFGREVVGELNRLGMFVDLSHVSDAVMHQALDVTSAPVLFSHSSARAVCDIVRNVPDDVLERLPGNGGVCMVAFAAMFVKQSVADWYLECIDLVAQRGGDPRAYADVMAVVRKRSAQVPVPPCTAEDVADHLDHIREVAGVDHVGIGSDFDGAPSFPTDLADVRAYPRLLEVLRSRGWSGSNLEALSHGNVLRAMRAVESAAE